MRPSDTTVRAPRSEPIRIIIIDDHDIARAGMRSLISGTPGIELVAEGGNGAEAFELCRQHQPDMVLMDVRMPGMDGLASTLAIKQEYPRITVMLITVHDSPEYMLMALRAGASGYLLKDIKRQDLIIAIRQVQRGEAFLNNELVTRVLQQIHGLALTHRHELIEHLTVRELEVLRILAKGHTNREIAEQLRISAGTVKVHVEHIIAKLQVSDRTQAAVRAIEIGLIEHSRG